jgi:hypothetical protein
LGLRSRERCHQPRGEGKEVVRLQYEFPALLQRREPAFEGILLKKRLYDAACLFGILRRNAHKRVRREILLQIPAPPVERKAPPKIAVCQLFAPVVGGIVILQHQMVAGRKDGIPLAGDGVVPPAEKFEPILEALFQIFHKPQPQNLPRSFTFGGADGGEEHLFFRNLFCAERVVILYEEIPLRSLYSTDMPGKPLLFVDCAGMIEGVARNYSGKL